MAAGFGVSISDLNLLIIFARQVHRALREEGGSASEYQKAATELQSWLSVLEHIQYNLQSANPTCRNILRSFLENRKESIVALNNRLSNKYGDHLRAPAQSRRSRGVRRKMLWSLEAAHDLEAFWLELARYSQQVQLVMQSENLSMMASMQQDIRTMQLLMRDLTSFLRNDLNCIENQQTTLPARNEQQHTTSIRLTLPAGRILNGGLTMSRLCDMVEPSMKGVVNEISMRGVVDELGIRIKGWSVSEDLRTIRDHITDIDTFQAILMDYYESNDAQPMVYSYRLPLCVICRILGPMQWLSCLKWHAYTRAQIDLGLHIPGFVYIPTIVSLAVVAFLAWADRKARLDPGYDARKWNWVVPMCYIII